MIKILDIGQFRQLDAHTIQHEPIASIDLMERACKAFVNWFVLKFDATRRITIVCGTGNNGGDGLGIARLLHERGYPINAWLVRGGNETADFSINLKRLEGKVEIRNFVSTAEIFPECDVLIDALFGSGLTRPAQGEYEKAINAMNNSDAIRVAVDIPSGLFADQHSTGPIVKAHHTVTFQLPRLAFLVPENHAVVGEWQIVDIGLDKSFIQSCEASRYYMTRKSVRKILMRRDEFSHKGDYGHALLIAGSLGRMGAAVLAARGALRAGAGLLTVHVPGGGNYILQTTVPEAMVSLDPNENIFSQAPSLDGCNVVGIGPGIGQSEVTVASLRDVLESGKPMILDADALNILGANRELLNLVPQGSILTPHPKEFQRLVGSWPNDFDRLTKQLALARQLQSVVLVKGAHTAMATPEGNLYFNCTGNPGMATGGSGDVLTGILTGLLAQGYSTTDTALLGTYLHGLAGDLAAREKGEHALIASDLIEFLPAAFRTLT